MTGVEALEKIHRGECEIKTARLRIAEEENKLLPSGIRYDKDNVNTSPKDQMFERIPELVDLIKIYEEKIREITMLKLRCERSLEKLEPKHRVILELYYLNGLPYIQIAETIDCSERWVYKLMKTARHEFNIIFEKS